MLVVARSLRIMTKGLEQVLLLLTLWYTCGHAVGVDVPRMKQRKVLTPSAATCHLQGQACFAECSIQVDYLSEHVV